MSKPEKDVELRSRGTGKVKVQSNDLFPSSADKQGEGSSKAVRKLPSKP